MFWKKGQFVFQNIYHDKTARHYIMASIQATPNLDILGVKFDSKLTLEDRVRGIVRRVSQRIDILRLAKVIFVDTSVLLRCYFAFVLPILVYCSPVWARFIN